MYDYQLGGCDQPASACEFHHVTHLADGGQTSVDGCALYCSLCRRRHKKHYADPRRPGAPAEQRITAL